MKTLRLIRLGPVTKSHRFSPSLTGLACLALFLSACAKPTPVLILTPQHVGDGGQILRDLYRSFWLPPADDKDLIRIGLIPEAQSVRFRATEQMRIRAYSETESWEVASPRGVLWQATFTRLVRPPLVTYFAGVAHRDVMERKLAGKGIEKWQSRGFSPKWVGPPAMDTGYLHQRMTRWVLSISSSSTHVGPQALCREVRKKWKTPCHVYGRIELPPIVEGKLSAENSNFEKSFVGFLELRSPRGPVEVHNIVPEEITGEVSAELFGPTLFVVPTIHQKLALVQSTSFGNYLEGVVPGEIFPSAHPNALRAQAIIARTYAARFVSASFSTFPYLICATTNCQVYRGIEFKQRSTSKAVRDTSDLVVRDAQGELAETFYHSICGGHTEPRTAIWGPPKISYLEGVSDQRPDSPQFLPLQTDREVQSYLANRPRSYCGSSSLTKADRWRWERHVDRDDVKSVLQQIHMEPPLTDLRVTRRGRSGRVLEVAFRNGEREKRIQGELKIRRLLGGLLSSLFVVDPIRHEEEIESLKILGGGYGHGVGLCQMGAIGRAESGQSDDEILTTYYPGTTIAPLVQP